MYLFQCGSTNRYALSLDETGGNIPITRCPGGWLLRGDISPLEDEADLLEPLREAELRGYCYLFVRAED